jgi:hypothetical protein
MLCGATFGKTRFMEMIIGLAEAFKCEIETDNSTEEPNRRLYQANTVIIRSVHIDLEWQLITFIAYSQYHPKIDLCSRNTLYSHLAHQFQILSRSG